MRDGDIEGLGGLAAQALSAGTGLVRAMHEGIASRPLGILGAPAAPVRLLHDGVSRAVYGAVGGGLATGSRAAGRALAPLAGGERRGEAIADSPRGSLALGIVNGLYGDHLSARREPLAVEMQLRHGGREVARAERSLAHAYPDATGRLALFAHGLFCDERAWRAFAPAGPHGRRAGYAGRLRAELGFTPLMLRYNTGLHVSENGARLADMLEELLAGWPVRVSEIALVGHSMGGLVVRSACHYGERAGQSWVGRVRHVFSLGSPHLGADLEKGMNVLSHAFRRLPETRGLAALLNARSAGIKDLRYGACVEEDWSAVEDPDEFLRDRCGEVPFLAGAHYYFIAASVSEGPLGSLLGDLLVRIPSASGRGDGRSRRISFQAGNGRELHGLHHMDLPGHPAVYEQLRTWLARSGEGERVGAAPA